MRGPRVRSDSGFALVESIAVLALTALVLLTLLIATDLVSRNSAAAMRSANTVETLATGLAAVRRDLEDARFLRLGPQPDDPVLFSGSPQAVALVVGNDGAGGGESLVLIEARYEGGIGSLVRSSAGWQPGTTGFGSAAFANHVLLMSGPWQYRFSYADPAARAERWRSVWSQAARLPAAVRLEVIGANSQPAVTPLVAQLKIDSGGCADAAQIGCEATGGVEEETQNDDQNGEDDADIDL